MYSQLLVERLVPTNCMRACTAVITEISYNELEIAYRAEIDFIAEQDWQRELMLLFEELMDGSGHISREASNEDSEPGVAYAKIKAVYPTMTKEMIEQSSVEALMAHANVSVLGTSRVIEHNDSLIFYRRLQAIIDSKEKSEKPKSKEQKKAEATVPAYWPLIKFVRLFVKSPALATGAIIVSFLVLAVGRFRLCSGFAGRSARRAR